MKVHRRSAVPINLCVCARLQPSSSKIKYILTSDFKGAVNPLWLQRPLWKTLLKLEEEHH